MINLFPYSEQIKVSSAIDINYQVVNELIMGQLTENRKKRISEVVENRTFNVSVVCEGLYDRGNVSAVMRSAEAFGFVDFHVIESGEKFKKANRVTKGSEKWLEIKKWQSSNDAIDFLKNKQKRKLIVTSLDANISIDEIDFSEPCAVVLGNEMEGVSHEMLEAADYRIKIPMMGFVQSFNISVAAAICLYHIFQQRNKLGIRSELTVVQKEILAAHYAIRTQDSSVDQLVELFNRGQV